MTEFKAHQLPATIDWKYICWNLDEYYVHFNIETKTLTVEIIEDIADDGDIQSTVISDREEIVKILTEYEPVLITHEGHITLRSWLDKVTIGTEVV